MSYFDPPDEPMDPDDPDRGHDEYWQMVEFYEEQERLQRRADGLAVAERMAAEGLPTE